MRLAVLLAVALLYCPPCVAAEKSRTAKIGYISRSVIMCRYADHCRDAEPGVEDEYNSYLKQFDALAEAFVRAEQPPEDLHGLAAREKLYGPCPARCISYNYPILLQMALKNIARHQRLDTIVDLPSVYYGAGKLTGGINVNDAVFAEVQRLRLIPPK
jgi:hypothetical protein